jgi:hypothetical protein
MTSISEPGADLSNWRGSPFNRWAFRNIDALMPTAPIWAGSAWDLPAGETGALGGFALRAGGQTLSLEAVLVPD